MRGIASWSAPQRAQAFLEILGAGEHRNNRIRPVERHESLHNSDFGAFMMGLPGLI